MTTYVQVRDTLATLVDTAWTTQYPSVAIFHENTKQIPLDTVGKNFLLVMVEFDDTFRTSVDLNPISESHGVIRLRLFAKEGSGVRTALGMKDYLTNALKYQVTGGITIDCPTPGRSEDRDGWTSMDLIVPFQFWR